ncbi:NADH:flavin oxidoreductase/NADH oxidase [Bradyrhizobium sp. 2TAF24]|uniref:NADH:flavin oxidoreductase/NADH oxidase n=1 Tax=Bradyrhizobium sp. 2TAF24 TaxID=3233011 RepID=UPI003F91C8C9
MTVSADGDVTPLLFQPLRIRDLILKNRVVISPMCQHAADFGKATDWHLVHLGRFAIGGAGLVFVESTAVDPRARVGVNDVGLWADDQIEPLRRIVRFVQDNGARIGVQLAHTGRKAGSEALWDGGRALTEAQMAASGEPWRRAGPSAIAAGPEWTVPDEMTPADIQETIRHFADATRRAERAGFDVIELHFGHGYLAASFLSPKSNLRTDAYGGSLENRMRMPLEAAAAVRAAWPQHKPLFVRISAVDGAEGGWSLDDSVVLAQRFKAIGVDVIDCSSGGLGEETRSTNVPRGLGFQVPFADRIRREAGMLTQAVGVILDGLQAERILQQGQADLIAVGREALFDPNWAVHAAYALGFDPEFRTWHFRHGGWLAKREPLIRKLQDEAQRAAAASGARS